MPSYNPDQIDKPDHYTVGGIEVRDYLRAKLGAECLIAHDYCSVLQYISRAPHKGEELTDLKKARWHLDKLIETLEHEPDEGFHG